MESLHTLSFIERRENVVFLGPPGVWKTHLAVSLAVAAAEGGRRVYYATLADLITSLEDAQQAGRLSHRLRTLVFPSLMIIDEIGYLPISRSISVPRRHGTRSRMFSRGLTHGDETADGRGS